MTGTSVRENRFIIAGGLRQCGALLGPAALLVFTGTAHAQCTPEGMARFNANSAQIEVVKARIRAGDYSQIAEYHRLFGIRHAIQHRSQLQTYPYTCSVDIRYPPPPPCGGNKTANTRPAQPGNTVSKNAQPSGSCSDITGTGGGGPGPSNCTTSGGVPPNVQSQVKQTQSNNNAPPPSHIVVLPSPQCSMCDVLTTVGEVLPDLAEKLNNIKSETINDAEPPLFGGGPNTLHPYLPRRPLAPVTTPQDPLDAINDMKDIASDAKALSDLMDKNKEPEDYAEKCEDGFLDASWKAFTAKDGSYAEKAKAARDSLKGCWKAAAKHIEDTIANGVIDPDRSSEGR